MKTIYNKFDKALINQLPRVVFEGRIVVILSPGETVKAVDFLLKSPILGIDTETRPSFSRGKHYKVSLLQVSTPDICFLFRLNYTGITPAIIRLLEDSTVPKIGLSLHDDIHSLHQVAEFTPGNFIDLQSLMKEIGIEDLSLQKLYANLFGQKISKNQQLTNWERDVLNEKQKRYAATDAWACIMLYREFLRLKQTGDFLLEVVPEPEPVPAVAETATEKPGKPEPKEAEANKEPPKKDNKTPRKTTRKAPQNKQKTQETASQKAKRTRQTARPTTKKRQKHETNISETR